MKFSTKVEKCGLSPMRKFHPYAVAARAKGRTIYHLNIGQPDIETPKACFDAVRAFDQKVLEYAPSGGVPELVEAIGRYYEALDIHYTADEILVTTGGSEALQITMNCILDDGDEILIPEPFYPNYSTMVHTCGAVLRPLPTCPEDALDALEADHDYLTAGGVFPEELLNNFIKSKREEYRQMVAMSLIAPEVALGWRFNLPCTTEAERNAIREKYMPRENM